MCCLLNVKLRFLEKNSRNTTLDSDRAVFTVQPDWVIKDVFFKYNVFDRENIIYIGGKIAASNSSYMKRDRVELTNDS